MSKHKHHRHHRQEEEQINDNMKSFSENIALLTALLESTDKEKLSSMLASLNVDEEKFRNIVTSLDNMFNKNTEA